MSRFATKCGWPDPVPCREEFTGPSLRVESDDSQVRSYPQLEIEMGATQIEEIFAEHMPATHAAFVANGRVAP